MSGRGQIDAVRSGMLHTCQRLEADRAFRVRKTHYSLGLLQPVRGRERLNPILFSIPLRPAASPAALAATGGLVGMHPKLATAGKAKSGDAGLAKTPKVASFALPAQGAWGGWLNDRYRGGLFPALLEPRGWSADIVDL